MINNIINFRIIIKNKGVIFYNNSKVDNIIYHKKKAIGININIKYLFN
jgi:hypothetical protein